MGLGAGPPALVRSADRRTDAGPSRRGRRRPAPTPAESACRLQGPEHPPQRGGIGSAGTRTGCPLGRTISTTAGILGTFAGLGTSVNTTGFSADEPFPSSALASRKTRRHQLRVLGGIPRFAPNSRSVKPLRCQRPNTRRIWRARSDVVDLCVAHCCTRGEVRSRRGEPRFGLIGRNDAYGVAVALAEPQADQECLVPRRSAVCIPP